MKVYNVTIKGVRPLLMHRMPMEALTDQPKRPGQQKPTPQEDAEAGAYRMDGPGSELYLPAEGVYQALVKAGTSHKMAGARGKTFKDTMKGFVDVQPAYIPLGVSEYEIDSRPVRIQSARIVRHRPILQEWEASFRLEVLDEKMVPAESLQMILATAGQTIGLLDYRPRFGRFIITKFEEAA